MTKNNWRVTCDGCPLDTEFRQEGHANKLMVLHQALSECEVEATYKEEL